MAVVKNAINTINNSEDELPKNGEITKSERRTSERENDWE